MSRETRHRNGVISEPLWRYVRRHGDTSFSMENGCDTVFGVMAERRDAEAVVYPGAPLRAVAIELSFQALLDAPSRFGVFQRRHLREFSRVVEPPDDERDAGRGDERTMLLARDRNRAVSVARNQLSAITYTYDTGFAGFTKWAEPMLKEGLGILEVPIEDVSTISYRYENRIRHKTSEVDMASLFRLSLAAPAEAGTTAKHLHLYWQQKWPAGTVEVDMTACPNVSEEVIRLNITSHVRRKDPELDAGISNAHRMARLTFEELITPEFREQLRRSK